MPLSEEDNEVNKAVVDQLLRLGKSVKRAVRVRPEVMDSFQRAMRMKLTLNFDGFSVMLCEDADAPENIEDAIAEACDFPKLQEGPACHQCGGASVKLGDGTFICTGCSKQVTPSEPSKIVLASERAELAKHSRRRQH